VAILLVDDNPLNKSVAQLILKRLGYQADAAASGKEAIAALDRKRYDLVLMDVQMPDMDGFQATAEIRRREGPTRHTPIVALTAHALAGDRERCLAGGMDDYLTKPVRGPQLTAMIARHVTGTAAAAPQAGAESAAAPPTLDVRELESLGELREPHEPHPALEVIDLYLATIRPSVASLRATLDGGDAAGLAAAAHALKGSSGQVGARKLAARCADLESVGRSGRFIEAVSLLHAIEGETDRVEAALREQRTQLEAS